MNFPNKKMMPYHDPETAFSLAENSKIVRQIFILNKDRQRNYDIYAKIKDT